MNDFVLFTEGFIENDLVKLMIALVMNRNVAKNTHYMMHSRNVNMDAWKTKKNCPFLTNIDAEEFLSNIKWQFWKGRKKFKM